MMRRLAERNVSYRVAPADDLSRSLEALARTHTSRWGERSVFTGDFERFAWVAAIGVTRGAMTFHEAVHDDEIVASLVTIDDVDVCFFFQTGRDPSSEFSTSSGTLLKARGDRRRRRAGARIVDLCYGNPQTKLDWADDVLPVLALRWSVGVRGHSVRALRNTVGATIRRCAPAVSRSRRTRARAPGAGRRHPGSRRRPRTPPSRRSGASGARVGDAAPP